MGGAFQSEKSFEATDLKRIFQFCIYLLSEIVKNDLPYPNNMVELIGHLLRICERILTWTYVSRLHILSNKINFSIINQYFS